MPNGDHKHRDLWLVVVGVCLPLAVGLPVAVWTVDETAPTSSAFPTLERGRLRLGCSCMSPAGRD